MNQQGSYINFSQDKSLFAIVHEQGFKVFTSSKSKEVLKRQMKETIIYLELLFQTNICALITEELPTKVQLWDDLQQKVIGLLSFNDPVKAVKLRTDKIIIILEKVIFVYNFINLKLLDTIDTYSNPKGLCSITYKDDLILCTLSKFNNMSVFVKLYSQSKDNDLQTKIIKGHKLPIQYIEVVPSGLKLASVSERGNNIRIFCTETGEQIQELRRGKEIARIYSISFSNCGNYLSCYSSSQTLHVFSLILTKEEEAQRTKDEAKGLSNMPSLRHHATRVFGCTSFAKTKLISLTKTIVSFNRDPFVLVAVSYSGLYQKYCFDPLNGGSLILMDEKQLII